MNEQKGLSKEDMDMLLAIQDLRDDLVRLKEDQDIAFKNNIENIFFFFEELMDRMPQNIKVKVSIDKYVKGLTDSNSNKIIINTEEGRKCAFLNMLYRNYETYLLQHCTEVAGVEITKSLLDKECKRLAEVIVHNFESIKKDVYDAVKKKIVGEGVRIINASAPKIVELDSKIQNLKSRKNSKLG